MIEPSPIEYIAGVLAFMIIVSFVAWIILYWLEERNPNGR